MASCLNSSHQGESLVRDPPLHPDLALTSITGVFKKIVKIIFVKQNCPSSHVKVKHLGFFVCLFFKEKNSITFIFTFCCCEQCLSLMFVLMNSMMSFCFGATV